MDFLRVGFNYYFLMNFNDSFLKDFFVFYWVFLVLKKKIFIRSEGDEKEKKNMKLLLLELNELYFKWFLRKFDIVDIWKVKEKLGLYINRIYEFE